MDWIIYTFIVFFVLVFTALWMNYILHRTVLQLSSKCNALMHHCDALERRIYFLETNYVNRNCFGDLKNNINKHPTWNDVNVMYDLRGAQIHAIEDSVSSLWCVVDRLNYLGPLADKYQMKESINKRTRELNEAKKDLKEIENELKEYT